MIVPRGSSPGLVYVNEDGPRWHNIGSAPKDGRLILAFNPSWGRPWILCWKTNPRTNESYFGDPDEHDDYDLAGELPATLWTPVPEELK